MGARRHVYFFIHIFSHALSSDTFPIFWDRIQPETFWLAGRKPWPATLFLIRENLKVFASPKELCETGMAAFDLFG